MTFFTGHSVKSGSTLRFHSVSSSVVFLFFSCSVWFLLKNVFQSHYLRYVCKCFHLCFSSCSLCINHFLQSYLSWTFYSDFLLICDFFVFKLKSSMLFFPPCFYSLLFCLFLCMYRQVSTLVHSAKCNFYTERIVLASSSKELHQIVNTFSNRHPPKVLPTIYPSADLPSIFIKHFTNKVEKLRANIASEHVTSTLVTGTTAATVSSFEKCHN